MLRFLNIKRLAVIDAVEVEFGPGLNVLTGETGAGKSILIEAVDLLLGGRASADLVRTGEELATIEAIFESGGEEYLVRREITAQGRSRAFINGSLATAGALRTLCARVIELHGQHEHYTLLDADTHLDVLDAVVASGADLETVGSAFDAWRTAEDELATLKSAAADRSARQELAAFQLAELDRANPVAGEDVELATTRQVLASAERIERLCEESYAALYESDAAVLASLGGVWRRLGELAAIEPQFQPYLDARDGIKSQLEDLAHFLRRYADGIDAAPDRLQQVEERLALLERLKRKHGPSLDEVIAKRTALQAQVALLSDLDERIETASRRRESARGVFLDAARSLSIARRSRATSFAKELERLLRDLAMDQTRFEVRFADEAGETGWTRKGIDQVEFFVSPNPGEDLRPLARIVSGGELSRVMLAIKTLTATSRHGFTDVQARPASAAAPGLVFDEIDAGIGGRVADVVGQKLRALGSAFQVLCITHQPQIASYADAHYQIEKRVERGRTQTIVRRLDEQGRVEELARMLGGAAISDAVRASAQEMLHSRRPGSSPVEEAAKGESERAKAKAGRALRRSS